MDNNSINFNVIVCGDNPDEIMDYFSNNTCDPYILYDISKAETYRKNALKIYEQELQYYKHKGSIEGVEFYEMLIEDTKKESALDYFENLSYGKETDINGNVISRVNPNMKFNSYSIDEQHSYPFILKDGSTSFSALKQDIDWDAMLNEKKKVYEDTWDIINSPNKHKDNYSLNIYTNMLPYKDTIISTFKKKDRYVKFNTSFVQGAFVSDKNWIDNSNHKMDIIDWNIDFFDKFIKKLPENSKLTLFVCQISSVI